jgi:hypothetical protein
MPPRPWLAPLRCSLLSSHTFPLAFPGVAQLCKGGRRGAVILDRSGRQLLLIYCAAASCSHWRIVRVGGPQTENWGFVHRLCQFLVSPIYRLYDAPGCISLKLLCRDHSRGRHAESGMKACSAEGICFCEEKGTNACEKGC